MWYVFISLRASLISLFHFLCMYSESIRTPLLNFCFFRFCSISSHSLSLFLISFFPSTSSSSSFSHDHPPPSLLQRLSLSLIPWEVVHHVHCTLLSLASTLILPVALFINNFGGSSRLFSPFYLSIYNSPTVRACHRFSIRLQNLSRR
jgi:hypothetical protein